MKTKKEIKKPLNIIEEANIPKMELSGSRQLVIDKCGGVLEYTKSRIRIRWGKKCAIICGSNLFISELGSGSITICGYILSINIQPY